MHSGQGPGAYSFGASACKGDAVQSLIPCRYVHVGESHRGYLGTGSIDFQPFFSALAASGYGGVITFESFSSRVVSPTLSNTLCVWRDLCARWTPPPVPLPSLPACQ